MFPFTFTPHGPHATFRYDDGCQGRARTCPLLRNRSFIIELITRRAAHYEPDEPQAGERCEQWGRREQRVLHNLHIQWWTWTRSNGETYEAIMLNQGDNVQCLEVWQSRGELGGRTRSGPTRRR